VWFELKYDLQFPSAQRTAQQLMAIAILLVPANLKIREEALNGFVEGDISPRTLVESVSPAISPC